jgi:dimethylhistidine N-methyltransferase
MTTDTEMLETANARAMEAQRAAFLDEVLTGLALPQKTISSRWLYDDAGSELFEEITDLTEYYPTRTETGILRDSIGEIAQFCGPDAVVIEYGAGASIKSELLLAGLDRPRLFVPIDIAGDFLALSAERLNERFPELDVWPVTADFTNNFDLPDGLPCDCHRVGFFPGSTIGNLAPAEAVRFLARVKRHVSGTSAPYANGRAIIGIDLVKPLDVLIPAYDDAQGVTAAFNLNLLKRINRELDGTFDLDGFVHEARWNAEQSAIEMHIRSRRAQNANVSDRNFSFAAGETIHTESSRKYTLDMFRDIANEAGWDLAGVWTDKGNLFAVTGLAL